MTLLELIETMPGYSGATTDQAALDWLNESVSRNKTSLTGEEMFQTTDGAEFAALTDVKKQLWISFCSIDSIDPFGAANIAFVKWVFGADSATITALAALRTENVARWSEAPITLNGQSVGPMTLGTVNAARSG